MCSHSASKLGWSQLGRLTSWLLLIGLLVAMQPAPALAGGDHDHSHDHAPTTAVTAASPRVSAQSGTYELVGVLKGEQLAIYLDRFATNEPVTEAGIAVTIGDAAEPASAEPAPDGTYTVASPRFAPGTGETVELVFAITAKDTDDLLIGTLVLPAKPPPAAASPHRHSPLQALQSLNLHELRDLSQEHLARLRLDNPYLGAGVALLLGFCLGLAVRGGGRRGWRLVPTTAVVLTTLLAMTGLALSHEDHDHGAAAKTAAPSGDVPQRLPDGALFVPKPSQRLLEVRTVISKVEKAQRAVNLIGRVIADPNRGGMVQSLNGGRVMAPDKGLPRIGQTVKRGDVLAQVEPALPQADRTTISEKVGDIEQQIAVAETKLNRIRPLAERGIVPQSQVIDAQTEIEGLKRRREIVGRARLEPEVLRAPIDGVISGAKAVAGQVVQAQDVLFQIVDQRGLWVEALVYNELNPAQIKDASAMASEGTPLKLTLQGFSRTLQGQANVVHFAIQNPPPSISVGQPVTVIVKDGMAVEGVIMPREAVVRGSNGESIVWRHTDPERFEPRPVRTEPFDATRIVVRGGITEGERVVVRGAELINQIR
jgi:cobalt-zinc-cadmium efflux system membrane fusion protein